MLTFEYIEDGVSKVFTVAGPILVEGNLPEQYMRPAMPTLEDYLRYVATQPSNMLNLEHYEPRGLRILDESEVDSKGMLALINNSQYEPDDERDALRVELTQDQAEELHLDDADLRLDKGKRVARSCGANKVWVANPNVAKGGYCRKLPKGEGKSRFTTKQKATAAALLAIAGGGTAAALLRDQKTDPNENPAPQPPKSSPPTPDNKPPTSGATDIVPPKYPTPADPWTSPAQEYPRPRRTNRTEALPSPGVININDPAFEQTLKTTIAGADEIANRADRYVQLQEKTNAFQANGGKAREVESAIADAQEAHRQLFNPITPPYFENQPALIRKAQKQIGELEADVETLNQSVSPSKRGALINSSDNLLRDIDIHSNALGEFYPSDEITAAQNKLMQTRQAITGVTHTYGTLGDFESKLKTQKTELEQLPIKKGEMDRADSRRYRQKLDAHKRVRDIDKYVIASASNQSKRKQAMDESFGKLNQLEAELNNEREYARNTAKMQVAKHLPGLRRKVDALKMVADPNWVTEGSLDMNEAGVVLQREFGPISTVEDRAAFREYAVEQLGNDIIKNTQNLQQRVDLVKNHYRNASRKTGEALREWKQHDKQVNTDLHRQNKYVEGELKKLAGDFEKEMDGGKLQTHRQGIEEMKQGLAKRQAQLDQTAFDGITYAKNLRDQAKAASQEILEFEVEGRLERIQPNRSPLAGLGGQSQSAAPVDQELKGMIKEVKRTQRQVMRPKTTKSKMTLTPKAAKIETQRGEIGDRVSLINAELRQREADLSASTLAYKKRKKATRRPNSPDNTSTAKIEAEMKGIEAEKTKLHNERRKLVRDLEKLSQEAREDGYTEDELPILAMSDLLRFDVDDLDAVEGYDQLLTLIDYEPDIDVQLELEHVDAEESPEFDIADWVAQVNAKK